MEFSRQEYWSGWPFPSPGDLPNPGIKPRSCALQAGSLPSEPPGKPLNKNKMMNWEIQICSLRREAGLSFYRVFNKLTHLNLGENREFPGKPLVAQTVKRLPTMQETWVQSLGREDPLEKEMATHSSILAWKIPWTEEPGRLQSMGLQRVGHDWVASLHFTSLHREFTEEQKDHICILTYVPRLRR